MKEEWAVVTGVSGFIGFRLAKELISRGINVFGVDIRETQNSNEFQALGGIFYNNEGHDFQPESLDSRQVKAIYHLGAIKRHEENLPFDYIFENNVLETRRWAKLAQELDCRLIFTSSLYVYGNYIGISKEEDALNPRTIYGCTKAMAELELVTRMNISNLNCGIARLYFVIGESDDEGVYSNVIHKFVSLAEKNEEITVYGSGTAVMNYVWISDVINSLITMGNSVERGICNIGNTHTFSILEIAKQISEMFAARIKFTQPDWTEGISRVGSVEKALTKFNLTNSMPLSEMISKILENRRKSS